MADWTYALCAGAAALAFTPAAAAVPAQFAQEADAMVRSAYPADGPGAAVIVTQGGKTLYASGAGLADVASGERIGPDTVFRLGSITKQFTAAVVLQLVDEGKIALDDPLSQYLPDYPGPGAEATVTQLLNHTSGIQSYTGIPGAMQPMVTSQPVTTGELIARFARSPVTFERGTRFAYNNSGYVLLGAIIEAVTGKPWHQAVEERIARPLGLATIRYGAAPGAEDAMARGYTDRDGKPAPAQIIHMSLPHAAGALIGTTGDLARWNRALHGGRVVKPESLARMIEPTVLADGSRENYAFGLSNSDVRGRRAIGHDGGIFGFSTASAYLPESDLFVAVFANSDAPATQPDLLVNRLAAAALGDPYPTFETVAVDPQAVAPLLGLYTSASVKRVFFARDGRYYTRREGGSDTEAFPAGGRRFHYGPRSLTWFEILGEPGGTLTMAMHQNGASQAETSVRTGPVPDLPPAAEVDPPRLRALAGDYASPIAPIAVRVGDDGRLTLKFGPQPAVPLIPLSQSEFRPEGVDARIRFTETEGRVSGLVLVQGGRELAASRTGDAP